MSMEFLAIASCGCGAGLATYLNSSSGSSSSAPSNRGCSMAEDKKGSKRSASQVDKNAEWLNNIGAILWPRVVKYLQDMMQHQIFPSINESLPKVLKGCVKLERMSIGSSPPKFGELVVRERSDKAIVIDLNVKVTSDLDVKLQAMKVSMGIRAFSFHGTLTMCLRPPRLEPPFFGGLEIYFINPPELKIEFTGAAHIAEWRMIRDEIHEKIATSLAKALVVPARVAVDLNPEDSVDDIDLQYPEPLGVLRLLIKSGSKLIGSDFSIHGGRTSDPYVTVELGQQRWRSKTVKKSTEPVWAHGNIADFLVYDMAQRVVLKVFDEDRLSKDDFLGEARGILAERFMGRGTPSDDVLQLYTADGSTAGQLTISTRWFRLTTAVPVHGIGRAVAHGPSQLVLSARLEDISNLPRDGAPPYTLHMTVSTREQAYKETSITSWSTISTSKEMRQVCLNLDRRGSSLSDIAEITGLPSRTCQMVIQKEKDPAALKELTREVEASNPFFRQVLRLLLPWTEEISTKAWLCLEVLDCKQRRVGQEVRRRVDQVAREGDAGPFQILPNAPLKARLSVRWLEIETA